VETCARFKFSEVKQNLDSIISFVDSDRQYNKRYLMLREMGQDVAREQHNRGTQTKIISFLNTVSIILSNIKQFMICNISFKTKLYCLRRHVKSIS
jgi:hypothetical protein